MKNVKVISIDAETDGLWGSPFSIAAIVYDEVGDELDKIVLRLPNSFVKNEWVLENVIPTLDGVSITHEDYLSMLKDFASFYMRHKDATVIWHMGHIVESFLFREMYSNGLIGEWDAPYTPIEVASLLTLIGYEKPDSVDSYAKEKNIVINNYGSTHNPLYDCDVAAKVFFHIKEIK